MFLTLTFWIWVATVPLVLLNGYAGVMVYAMSDSGSPALLNTLLSYWSNAAGG